MGHHAFVAGVAKNHGRLPPGFPVGFGGAVESHSAFLLKATHVNVGECHVAENPGRPVFFGPGTPWRTWGTRPVPAHFLLG
jgi:hypothetical protein